MGAMAAAWNPTNTAQIIAVGMQGAEISSDAGATWNPVQLPSGASAVTYAPDGKPSTPEPWPVRRPSSTAAPTAAGPGPRPPRDSTHPDITRPPPRGGASPRGSGGHRIAGPRPDPLRLVGRAQPRDDRPVPDRDGSKTGHDRSPGRGSTDPSSPARPRTDLQA
jgi:hypothetical protein